MWPHSEKGVFWEVSFLNTDMASFQEVGIKGYVHSIIIVIYADMVLV